MHCSVCMVGLSHVLRLSTSVSFEHRGRHVHLLLFDVHSLGSPSSYSWSPVSRSLVHPRSPVVIPWLVDLPLHTNHMRPSILVRVMEHLKYRTQL